MSSDTSRELMAIEGKLKAIGMLLLLQQLPDSKKLDKDKILRAAAVLLGVRI